MGERLRLLTYPIVEVAEGQIIHSARAGRMSFRYATPRLLDDLSAVQTPEAALQLARRYGPFLPPETPAPETTRRVVIEPIDVILDWCGWLPAAVNIGRMLAAGRRAPDAVARALGTIPRPRESLGLIIGLRLNHLLEMTRLRPFLAWDTRTARWSLTVSNSIMSQQLDSVLGAAAYFALRRMLEADEGAATAVCAVCGRLFEPARKPAANRACYCPGCRGSSEMWRMLKRRQRARG